MRTFFFMHAVGQLCRIRKLKLNQHENEDSEIIIEGIFDSCDANSTHLILLEAVVLKVYGSDPYNTLAKTELIRRAEKASINMAEVKEVKFAGVNITKDGMQVLKSVNKKG